MTLIVLVGLGAYGALAFGVRSYLHWRRTGSTGYRGISGRPFSAAWAGGMSFAGALACVVFAPIADLLSLPRLFESSMLSVSVGIAAFVAGAALTFLSQLQMGDAWRVGVDAAERTALVSAGLFKLVRNPIFSSMWLVVLSVALLVPSAVSLPGLVLMTLAIQLQVRFVEEPYLERVHGARYAEYASSVGRFVPGVGRTRRSA